jgi:hypothetical protein
MSDLTDFRDHCRDMQDTNHKPGCSAALTRHQWDYALRWGHADPGDRDCPGCNPQADRDLFRRLADEIDQHLQPPDDDQPLEGMP